MSTHHYESPPVLNCITPWRDDRHLGLDDIETIVIAAYIEELGTEIVKPSVKQHLAAIRQLFD